MVGLYRVPAADAKISQQAMDETFFLTNIAPQVGDGFNRHCEFCERLMTQRFDDCAPSGSKINQAIIRLGIPRGLLSKIDNQFRRCLRLHVGLALSAVGNLKGEHKEITLLIDLLPDSVPLYLPSLHPDGKWRVVNSFSLISCLSREADETT